MKRPFSSFTGLEAAQSVLTLLAVNPKIGSVLLSGRRGTGKTSLVNAFSSVLPNREIIKLPLSITEEALYGSFDMEQTFTQGRWHYQKGLLAKVHRNILFIDNVNLLSNRILNLIWQVKEQGFYLTNDGLRQPCNFAIIATMNPEEGSITSKDLDRFTLFLEMPERLDLGQRLEVLKEEERWAKDFERQNKTYEKSEAEWRERILKAQSLVSDFQVKDVDYLTIAQTCKEAFVAGHRGDLALLWATLVQATLQGRQHILMEDLLAVKDFALAHRIRSPKQAPEEKGGEEDKQEGNVSSEQNHSEENNDDIPEDSKSNESNPLPQTLPESIENNASKPNNEAEEECFDIGDLELNIKILDKQHKTFEKKLGTGKRIKSRYSEGKGRQIRSKKRSQKSNDIDFVATLRAAAPYQKFRDRRGLAIRIYKDDLQQRVREQRIGNTILFLLDTSGSMGLKARMTEAKAAVFSLLKDAYVHRDSVGLMTFRNEESELLLPPTRSFSRAYDLLQDIKTGGRTPLFNALQSALELITALKVKDKSSLPVLVLFTDGKATSSYKGENTMEHIQQIAQRYVELKLNTFVIDTECGFIRLGYAKQISQYLGATYFHLDDLKEEELKKHLQQ